MKLSARVVAAGANRRGGVPGEGGEEGERYRVRGHAHADGVALLRALLRAADDDLRHPLARLQDEGIAPRQNPPHDAEPVRHACTPQARLRQQKQPKRWGGVAGQAPPVCALAFFRASVGGVVFPDPCLSFEIRREDADSQ